ACVGLAAFSMSTRPSPLVITMVTGVVVTAAVLSAPSAGDAFGNAAVMLVVVVLGLSRRQYRVQAEHAQQLLEQTRRAQAERARRADPDRPRTARRARPLPRRAERPAGTGRRAAERERRPGRRAGAGTAGPEAGYRRPGRGAPRRGRAPRRRPAAGRGRRPARRGARR